MHIAVVGCGHGEIDKIYDVVANIEEKQGIKVGLVLCCGDFQSVRNMTDLRCMACPIKYQHMHDFHRYYSGEKQAPVLTLFIGGNHEASNFLQELPFGGWVAPNIFYMGYAGVVKVGSLRIAGMSGIYKGHDYLKGRHEFPPYSQSTIRSVYHYRNLDVFRLKQLKQPIDIILSHDWPKGIHQYGDFHRLLQQKRHFRDEIERNELGSRPLYEILETLQPSYWFSAHMHVKFAAYVLHSSNNLLSSRRDEGKETTEDEKSGEESTSVVNSETHENSKVTRFLALDKVLPGRQFLQIVEIPTAEEVIRFEYDPEWLAILKSTNELQSILDKTCFMPGPGYTPRSDYSATSSEIEEVVKIFEGNFIIENKFEKTSPAHQPGEQPQTAFPTENPYTKDLCTKLEINDPITLLVAPDEMLSAGRSTLEGDYLDDYSDQLDITMNRTSRTDDSFNPDEISIDLDDDAAENEDMDNPDNTPVSTTDKDNEQAWRTRSRLVLPPPKLDNDTVSSDMTDGNRSFRRSTLVLPPPKATENENEDTATKDFVSSLFFLDTDGEPNNKRQRAESDNA